MRDHGNYTKFGAELADALDEVADNPDLVGDPAAAFEVLGITLPPETIATADMDPERLHQAADAIRAGAIPALWPWIWYIPWVGFVPPEGEETS